MDVYILWSLHIYLQKGFNFEKVSEIIALKVLPKVIKVGAAWHGSGSSVLIERNELLVVKRVKTKLMSKCLKVFSLTKKTQKELPENCVGMLELNSFVLSSYYQSGFTVWHLTIYTT